MLKETVKTESFTEGEQHLLALNATDPFVYEISSDELIKFTAAPTWACCAAIVEGGVLYFQSSYDYDVWKFQN